MKSKKLCIILAVTGIFLLGAISVAYLIEYNTPEAETTLEEVVELEYSIDVLNQSVTGIIRRYEFRIFEGHQYTYPGPQLTGIKTIINILPACYVSSEPEPLRNGSNVSVYEINTFGNNRTILEFEGFVQFAYNIPPEGFQINEWGYYDSYPQGLLGTIRFDSINGVNIFKSFEEITKPEGTYWAWNMNGCD